MALPWLINIYIITFVGSLAFAMLKPILPLFTRNLGATATEVGLIFSGFMLARAIFAILTGVIADKWGKRKLWLYLGFMGFFLCTFMLIFVHTYWQILVLRFLAGIASGIVWPLLQMITAEASTRNRTKMLSFYYLAGKFGMLGGGLLTAGLITLIMRVTGVTESATFVQIFGISALFILITFVFIPRIKVSHQPTTVPSSPYSGRFSIIFCLAFVLGMFMSLTTSVGVLYLRERFGFAARSVAIAIFTIDLVGMVTMYVISRIADTMSSAVALRTIILPASIAAIVLPLVGNPYLVVVLLAIVGAAISSFMPVSRAIAVGEHTGKKIGALNTLSNLGSVVGGPFGGLFYDRLTHMGVIDLRVISYSILGVMMLLFLVFIQPRGGVDR